MKAVLEFSYPEDEDKLRHALHGSDAISALDDVRRTISGWHTTTESEYEELIHQINMIVCDALRHCGEE